MDGREWIETLPPKLVPQARMLRRFTDAVQADERFRALEIGCSFARGNPDELSDLDVGLWIADESWDEALTACERMLRGLGTVLDSIAADKPWGRWLFVQYEGGAQLDVAAQGVSDAKGRIPGSVVLFDRDGVLAQRYEPDSYRAGPARIREWRFHAWFDLGNVAKYLDRSALWEALRWLEDARRCIAQLHAAQLGVPYPGFGVTSIFDVEGIDVPDGFGETYALPDLADVRRAALACAQLLESYEPPPLADWVRARLS